MLLHALPLLLAAQYYSNRRDCASMRFCRENLPLRHTYVLNASTISFESAQFTAHIVREDSHPFTLLVYQLSNVGFRVRIDPLVRESFTRFDASLDPNIIDWSAIRSHGRITHEQADGQSVLSARNGEQLRIVYDPLSLHFSRNGEPLIDSNTDKRLLFESNSGQRVSLERFRNVIDPIPNGPTAVGLDFHFFGNKTQLSGLSPRSLTFNLHDTPGRDFIRLFNIGAFGEYGVLPFFIGHARSYSAAFFWINPADGFVQIWKTRGSRRVRIINEGGYVDFVLFSGTPKSLLNSYTLLTGRPMFAPFWALGYHQCKWGYHSQKLVQNIITQLDKNRIPMDTFWLDIDHLKGKQPFIVDPKHYPDMPKLYGLLKNRHLVRITDCHVPLSNAEMYGEGTEHNFFIKEEKRDFVAECWPGKSSWPNFLDANARVWWASKFALTKDMPANCHIWNDMNEPAVFPGCEGTFPKTLIHRTSDGVEHEDREVHNLYGLMNAAGTYLGLCNRTGGVNRPFILTRSFFSGTQKFAWTWSGDNTAQWQDLKVSIASLIVSGLGGIPFTGTDVGGFFGNSTEELLVRWYQAGAWCYPFFREHADFNSAFREPYLFGDPTLSRIRAVIEDRYRMLPLWYTAVRNANLTGEPVVQPLWFEFPDEEALHTVESEVLVGGALLVAPAIAPRPMAVLVVKPPGKWYSFVDGIELVADANLAVGLSEVPVYIRGGRIVPAYTKSAMTTQEILATPITLHIALDEKGTAVGSLYLDDGETHKFLEGEFLKKTFTFADGVLSSTTTGKVPEQLAAMIIDQLVFYSKEKVARKVDVRLVEEFSVKVDDLEPVLAKSDL